MHNNKTDNFPPIEECFPDENSFCSTHTAADAPKKKKRIRRFEFPDDSCLNPPC